VIVEQLADARDFADPRAKLAAPRGAALKGQRLARGNPENGFENKDLQILSAKIPLFQFRIRRMLFNLREKFLHSV